MITSMLPPYRADGVDCYYWFIHYREDLAWTALDLLFVIGYCSSENVVREAGGDGRRKKGTGREVVTRGDSNKEEDCNRESKQSFAKRPFSAPHCQK